MIVVTGIERDLSGAPGIDHRAEHLERLVAIERCNFDRYDLLDFHHPSPEGVWQHPPADGRLQVEGYHRDRIGHRADMRRPIGFLGGRQGRRAHEPGVVAQLHGQLGFGDGLCRLTADAGDPDEVVAVPGLVERFRRQLEHRPQ